MKNWFSPFKRKLLVAFLLVLTGGLALVSAWAALVGVVAALLFLLLPGSESRSDLAKVYYLLRKVGGCQLVARLPHTLGDPML